MDQQGDAVSKVTMSQEEFDRLDPLAPFTRDCVLRMSPDQVTEFWIRRNRLKRDRGEDHFTTLIDPVTGETVATI